jgi:hypothetical protein
LRARGAGCEPATPAFPPPGRDGSKVFESCRESSDLEGSVDWEKGVVGDVSEAEVLAPPFAPPEKDVVSCGGRWFVELAGVAGLCMAERAM